MDCEAGRSEAVKVWKIEKHTDNIRQVECEVFDYSHRDSEGDRICVGSDHFAMEQDAWDYLKEHIDRGRSGFNGCVL
jgi:hypothetical protein